MECLTRPKITEDRVKTIIWSDEYDKFPQR